MQALKLIKENKIIKTVLIILSIPLIVQILYYINLLGIYFGTALRRFVSYWPC